MSIQGQVRYNESILAFAVKCGQTDSAKVLIEHGANVHARDGLGRSVLLTACFYGNFDAAKMLIQHGADVNVRTRNTIEPFFTISYVIKMCLICFNLYVWMVQESIEERSKMIVLEYVRIERSLQDGKETLY